MVAALVLVIAGCSTTTNRRASTDHRAPTDHKSLPVPDVTGVTPPIGTTVGGTTVTITGTGLTGTTNVAFGAVPAINFRVVSDTEIIAVSPPQAASIQNVHVTTAGGTSEPLVAVDPFTYVNPAAAVTGIAPSSGTTAGGTSVTITGTGFTGATRVAFGTAAATDFTVVSDAEITAVSPARAAGVQDIQVIAAGGIATPVVPADKFTYVKPAVAAVAPSSGAIAGGTSVTITGTGFTGATRVAFGTAAATDFTVVSDSEITAISPAQAAGTRNVVVTLARGTTTSVVAADLFTYKA
jgi:hypothetical protein